MGGCSSKPQTAEYGREVSVFHTALKTSDSSAHQTLESLFNQHGRDGENLLEDAQTLHELLLHAVESKELPDCKNQSALDVTLTTENAENCTQTKQGSSISDLIENDLVKGAATLEESLPGTTLAAVVTDENCRKAEVTPLDFPGKVVENRIEECGILSNVAEGNQENAGMSKAFAPDLADVKPYQAEECGLPKVGGENAIKLESGVLDLEPKSDLQRISVSALPGCAEHEMRGLNLGPKSDDLKNLEPNLLESLPTNDLQKIEAPQSMESKEADPQVLNKISTKGAIKRQEMAMEISEMPKPDEKCEKNEKVMQGEGVEEHSEKATESERIENAMEDEKTELQCAKKALAIDTDRHDGANAELQNDQAMEAEPSKIHFENGRELSDQGKQAMEENTLSEKTEEAMESEKKDMQDEKAEEASGKAGVQDEDSMREEEKTGVQNERAYDGEVENLQRDENEEAVHMKTLVDAEDKGKTGVQNERNLDGEVEKSHRDEDGKSGRTEKLAVAQGEEITVGAAQHCEAEKLDDKKDAKAGIPEESLIKVAMTEKGDDKFASDPLGAKEEKKAVETLGEHGRHEAGNLSAAEEKSCMECVGSKPNQKKATGEVIDDAKEIGDMEASKQCKEKAEDLKVLE